MKELQDKLIELTLKYLEFENPNHEQNSALHKIKEVRKSLDCLNVSLNTVEINLDDLDIKSNNLLERYVKHILKVGGSSFVHTMKSATFSSKDFDRIKEIEEKYINEA